MLAAVSSTPDLRGAVSSTPDLLTAVSSTPDLRPAVPSAPDLLTGSLARCSLHSGSAGRCSYRIESFLTGLLSCRMRKKRTHKQRQKKSFSLFFNGSRAFLLLFSTFFEKKSKKFFGKPGKKCLNPLKNKAARQFEKKA
ncbi:MAG: hypothetical protein IKO25_09005 [Clostridia bacterium]|nr:hypothetical protein [Clostridia bacterium]